MPSSTHPAAAEVPQKPRRSLAPYLLTALLFQVCVLTGVLASPFFQRWKPRPLAWASDPASLIVRWRQSVYRRENDPHTGAPAPPLHLRTLTGQPFGLTDLKGKKVALIFAKDGSG